MIVVTLDKLKHIDHIAGAGYGLAALLVLGYTGDEGQELRSIGLTTLLQLLADVPEYGVLMRSVAEDGTAVLLQLALEFTDEVKVGEMALLCVDELAGVTDAVCAVRIEVYDVV